MNLRFSNGFPGTKAAAFLPTIVMAALCSIPAWALPVTESLDLDVGGERFLRVDANPIFLADPPDIVSFEPLPTGEVFVTGKAKGRGILLVTSDGTASASVLRVRVREPGGSFQQRRSTPQELDAARKACASLVLQSTVHGQELEAEVTTPECRKAVLELLRDDGFLARNVAFSFTGEVMQAQLKAIEARLAGRPVRERVQLFYMGATLVIRGKMSAREKLELLRIAWEETPGKLIYDDRTERIPDGDSEGGGPSGASSTNKPSPGTPSDAPDAGQDAPDIQVESLEKLMKEHPELFDNGPENGRKSLK